MGTELVDISIESAIAFFYLGIGRESDRVEDLIEKGIYLGANSGSGDDLTGEVTDVQVSIDIKRNPDVEKIKKKMDRGSHDELTPAEIGVLVRKGELSPDDLKRLEGSWSPVSIGEYSDRIE
ncbi:hypothetical protein [Salinigranum rubrum]|uniref:hypothetical protein n=1 Tax=Salinigranum rubrum TaxID=755307 RepID=UPI0013A574E0|nr:hypothetical protein [Salinigranum rubrum]